MRSHQSAPDLEDLLQMMKTMLTKVPSQVSSEDRIPQMVLFPMELIDESKPYKGGILAYSLSFYLPISILNLHLPLGGVDILKTINLHLIP